MPRASLPDATVAVWRLQEGVASGLAPVMIPTKGPTSGMTSAAISNNYARSEGQNIGNFLTDRRAGRTSLLSFPFYPRVLWKPILQRFTQFNPVHQGGQKPHRRAARTPS